MSNKEINKAVESTAVETKDNKENKTKKKFNKRKLKHGTMAYVLTVLFVAVVVLINVVVGEVLSRIPSTIDMTSTNAFSISGETIDYIEKIDVPITIYVMAPEADYVSISSYTKQTNEILKKYAQHSDNITVEYKDLLTNPDFVSEYTETIDDYDIIVEAKLVDEKGESYKRVKVIDLLDTVDYGENTTSIQQMIMYYGITEAQILYNYEAYVVASVAEQEITSAIMTVTDSNPVTVTIATLSGAKESDISAFTDMLSKNGYLLNTIDIRTDEIPAETSVLVIPAPKLDYGADEIKKISDYLNNGGKLDKDVLYIASAEQPDTPNLDEFLAEYGIEVTDKIICETDTNYYYNYVNHTYQFAVSENYKQDIHNSELALFLPNALSINALWETEGMKSTEVFISSSSKAVLAPNNASEEWTPENATEKGVFNSMVVGSKAVFLEDNTASYSNVAVLSSDAFLTYVDYTPFLNGEFILSFMNGMTGKTNTGVTIVPKTFSGATFEITEAQKNILKWTFQLVIPLIVLAVGVVVWVRRRHR